MALLTPLFKKFTVYQLSRSVQLDNFQDLVAALDSHQPADLDAMQMEGHAFARPLNYAHAVHLFSSKGESLEDLETLSLDKLGGPRDMLLLMHHVETKVVLGNYVKREQEKRVKKMSHQLARPITRGEKEQIKSEIISALLPTAQTRVVQTPMLFTGDGLLLVGAHGKYAEMAISYLRSVTGTLPVVMAKPVKSVSAVMTAMAKQKLTNSIEEDSPFMLMSDIQASEPGGGRCRATGIELDSRFSEFFEEAQVSHAAFNYRDEISFKLEPDARVSGIKFLAVIQDSQDEAEKFNDAYYQLTYTVELAKAVFNTLLGGFDEMKYLDDDDSTFTCHKYFGKSVEPDENPLEGWSVAVGVGNA